MRIPAPSSLLFLAALIAGCSAAPSIVHYTITTNSRLVCCRTLSFETGLFSGLAPVTGTDTGLVVHLEAERMLGDCERGAEVPVVIANYTGRDRYIPFSHELDGTRLLLYPWRSWNDSVAGAMRLARQIQYGDLFEHNDARLRLMKLPAGMQVRFRGIIPGKWLCTPPTELYVGYLEAELDPGFYAQRSRGIRTSRFDQAKGLTSPIGLRYDVVSTGLEFLEAVPISSRVESRGGDTVRIKIEAGEEPAEFLNASQRVSLSNVVQLVIDGTKVPPDTSIRK